LFRDCRKVVVLLKFSLAAAHLAKLLVRSFREKKK
jgi:hypothetical protein